MLTELVLHTIMKNLRRVDQQALRCVNKSTSTIALLSIKRDHFCRCTYCYERIRKGKPSDNIVIKTIRLNYVINLECGCRVHRDCYILSEKGIHKCYYIEFQTMFPGEYYPKPALVKLGDPKFRIAYDVLIKERLRVLLLMQNRKT